MEPEEASQAEKATTAFSVVRDVPSKLTARVQKATASAVKLPAPDSSSVRADGIMLQAFPPVVDGEGRAHRAARMAACDDTWSAFSAQAQASLQSSSRAALRSVCRFVRDQHCARTKRRCQAAPDLLQKLIPTAVAIAGGVSAADHSSTFGDLVKMLQAEGCYAALLRPRDLQHRSGSLAGALQRVLRQFSGAADAGGCDMRALKGWYTEQLETRPVNTAAPPTTPGKRKARSAADQLSSPLDKLGLTSPTGRRTRQTGASPLASPMGKLQDLIHVFSEGQGELPVTVVLGMATCLAMLDQMLPAPSRSLLHTQPFRLMQAVERMEELVSSVLLGSKPPALMWGPGLLSWAHKQSLLHDCTPASLLHCMQVAAIGHFQAQPLSSLAAAAMQGPEAIHQVCSTLDAAVVQHAHAELCGSRALMNHPGGASGGGQGARKSPRGADRGTGRGGREPSRKSAAQSKDKLGRERGEVADAVAEAMTAWSAWAATCHLLNAAAKAFGSSSVLDTFALRTLYFEAASPSFLDDSREALQTMAEDIERIASPHKLTDTVPQLLDAIARPWHGKQSLAQEAAALQAILAEAQTLKDAPSTSTDAQPSIPGSSSDDHHAQPQAAAQNSQAAPRRHLAGPNARAQAIQSSVQAAREAHLAKVAQLRQQREAGAAAAVPVQKLARKLAAIVEQAAFDHLATHPTTLPGAKALCCEMGPSERQALTFAPRYSVHAALAKPHLYMGNCDQQKGAGIHAGLEDACIAYQLFLEYGESIDVADWFAGFCQVYGRSIIAPAEAAEEASAPGKGAPASRGRRGPRGSRKVFQAGTSGTAEKAAAPSQSTPQKRQRGRPRKDSQVAVAPQAQAASTHIAAGNDSSVPAEGAVVPEEQDNAPRVPMQELATRFTQATRELQLLGLLRPSKRGRRHGNFAQKLVFQSGGLPWEGQG
ncbi:hypothetical protein WJX73_004174 [Symbiochloris irregularis]|uniref:Origin recognition complex subunit 3 winged helix C-terminal domain-containing protein n=1 Tax=Symbiochloris irregularis TaxID=706552 RepID=A0AAW1NR28_9CHLO